MFVTCKIHQIGSQYKDPRVTIVVDSIDTSNPDLDIIEPISPTINCGNLFGNFIDFGIFIDTCS